MDNRVLIIKLTPYDVLGSSTLRVLALIKGLYLSGYQIDWLTLPSSSLTTSHNVDQYDFLKDVKLVFANSTNTVYSSIVTEKTSGSTWISLLRGVYHRLSVYDHTEKIARNLSISILPSNEYRYIISVSDPKTSHIAAEALIKQGLRYEKWIEYWGDPLVHDITKPSIYPTAVLKIFERKLMKNCDRIVYTSPFTLNEEKKLHSSQASKMVMTPTAYIDEKRFPSACNTKFVVGYYGAYYSAVRNIVPLGKACRELSDQVELIVCGDSDKPLEGGGNVTVHTRGDITEFEKRTDLFVCVLNLSGSQIPGKIYHCAATNKPVLVVLDGDYRDEMIEYLKGFDRYILCENSETAIREAIQMIINEKRDYQPCSKMSPEIVAEKILGLHQ